MMMITMAAAEFAQAFYFKGKYNTNWNQTFWKAFQEYEKYKIVIITNCL